MGANADLGLPRGDRMDKFVIAFDVDGTLIRHANANIIQKKREFGEPYPFDAANLDVVEYLILSSRIFKNADVIVWSGGGKDYAQRWVDRLQLQEFVWKVMSKTEYKELRKLRQVIAVDDIQDTRLGDAANLIVRMK